VEEEVGVAFHIWVFVAHRDGKRIYHHRNSGKKLRIKGALKKAT
jgi:hypothetical protein